MAPGTQPDSRKRRQERNPAPVDSQVWSDAAWGISLRSSFQHLPRLDGLEIVLNLKNDPPSRSPPPLICRVRVECDGITRFDDEVFPDSTVEIQVRPLAQISSAQWDLADNHRRIQVKHLYELPPLVASNPNP